MDRSEYYSRLASIIVGEPCFVAVRGERTVRETAGDHRIIILPERGMALGILSDLMPRANPGDGTASMGLKLPPPPDLPSVSGLDDPAAFRFLIERFALYLEYGRLRYESGDASGLSETERIICGVLEGRRAEALLSKDFPVLTSKFEMVDRAMLVSATPHIARMWRESAQPQRARTMLFFALKQRCGLDDCAKDDKQVRRTAELIAYVDNHPHEEGVVLRTAHEILRLVADFTPISLPVTGRPHPCPFGSSGGQSDEGASRSSEDGTSDAQDTDTIYLEEEAVHAIIEISKEMRDLGITPGQALPVLIGTEKSGKLIDHAVMVRTAGILRRMKGSMRSYNEVLRDEGYALDPQSVVQLKAGSGDTRHLFYNYKRERQEFDMVICLDRSASMEGERLQHAKGYTATLVRALEMAGVSTAVTAYNESSMMVKPWETTVENCALSELGAGGGTSISQALQVANQLLDQRLRTAIRTSRRHAIILISDGQDYYLRKIATQIATAQRRGTKVMYIGIGHQCRRFLRIGSEHFRYDHSVIIDHSEQMGEALSSLARAFIREA